MPDLNSHILVDLKIDYEKVSLLIPPMRIRHPDLVVAAKAFVEDAANQKAESEADEDEDEYGCGGVHGSQAFGVCFVSNKTSPIKAAVPTKRSANSKSSRVAGFLEAGSIRNPSEMN